MLTSSNGIKIGVIGLGEREWLDTINSLPQDIIYKSASETAKELIPGLREQGAEIIVAVTHQREPNDNKLAEKTGGDLIDIILGGHDHYYSHSYINGTHVLRSGTDFKQLSHIEVWRRKEGGGWDFRIARRDVVSSVPQDPAAVQMVEELTNKLKAKLDKPIGSYPCCRVRTVARIRLMSNRVYRRAPGCPLYHCSHKRIEYRELCLRPYALLLRG